MKYEYITLTGNGCLHAGTDVHRALLGGDERELIALWHTHQCRATAQRVLSHPKAAEQRTAMWTRILDETASVTALEALGANHLLVDLLTERRWLVMRDAREGGASWTQIGAALGMSKQGAQDWYQRKIEQQELHLSETHDAERARAALADDEA